MAVSPSDSSTVGRIRSSREAGRPLHLRKEVRFAVLLEGAEETTEEVAGWLLVLNVSRIEDVVDPSVAAASLAMSCYLRLDSASYRFGWVACGGLQKDSISLVVHDLQIGAKFPFRKALASLWRRLGR